MQNNTPYVPVSIGELLDKITILTIKKIKIKNETQLANINKELDLLNEIVEKLGINNKKLYKEFMYLLYETNNCLWNIENRIREFEQKKQFDELFINEARKVYEFNDRRAKIKKDINLACGSNLVEEKSYEENHK